MNFHQVPADRDNRVYMHESRRGFLDDDSEMGDRTT